TLRCVASALERGAAPGFETRIVVVDNDSKDGTSDALRERFRDRVDLVANTTNVGFGSACNQGAACLPGAAWFLFLNADVALLPNALATLVASGEAHGEAAVLGPAVVGDDG